jgi:hypothetical protein
MSTPVFLYFSLFYAFFCIIFLPNKISVSTNKEFISIIIIIDFCYLSCTLINQRRATKSLSFICLRLRTYNKLSNLFNSLDPSAWGSGNSLLHTAFETPLSFLILVTVPVSGQKILLKSCLASSHHKICSSVQHEIFSTTPATLSNEPFQFHVPSRLFK